MSFVQRVYNIISFKVLIPAESFGNQDQHQEFGMMEYIRHAIRQATCHYVREETPKGNSNPPSPEACRFLATTVRQSVVEHVLTEHRVRGTGAREQQYPSPQKCMS